MLMPAMKHIRKKHKKKQRRNFFLEKNENLKKKKKRNKEKKREIFAVFPLDFHGSFGWVHTMFIPRALHGVEASPLSWSSVLKLRSALVVAVWSERQPHCLTSVQS